MNMTIKDSYKFHFKKGNKIIHARPIDNTDRKIKYKEYPGWSKKHIRRIKHRIDKIDTKNIEKNAT